MRATVIPSFARILADDLLQKAQPIGAASEHLRSAVEWLQLAQDRAANGGVSYGYSVRGGWRPAYIETSGYILITFFDVAKRWADAQLRERAVRAGQWLTQVQRQDGSFANPRFGTSGIVFDTGQVLLGLVRAFDETQDESFLAAAERAADWLVQVSDSSGRWTRCTYRGVPHAYNTRVAWALLEADRRIGRRDGRRERVARANLDWAVSQQRRGGWFQQCGFEAEEAPFTHNIAYAVRGLLESGRLLKDAQYEQSAVFGAEAALSHIRGDGFIPGRITADGRAAADYCCLTGNCQLSIIWSTLHEQTGHERYKVAAVHSLRYVMATQDTSTPDVNVRGAIKGSQPVWGRYAPMSFPNWATGFYVDALLRAEPWL